jgi:alpha/beta superfamily hydrolase
MVLVGPAFSRLAHWDNAETGGKPPPGAIIIHGESDETVPLAASLDWARPRNIPVIVVPGADHFFHQRLHIIKRIVSRFSGSA